MPTNSCQARPDRYEPSTLRCAKCRLRWDVDDPDPPLCGLKVATRDLGERLEYVSALAPPRWR